MNTLKSYFILEQVENVQKVILAIIYIYIYKTFKMYIHMTIPSEIDMKF